MHVVAHGGAGSAPDRPTARQRELERAREAGVAAADPLAAVVAAVRHLETAPAFNAGVGSAVQHDGVARTDAGLMDSTGTCGAACAMPGVEHAVDVARAVAGETPHVCVSGEGALALAESVGVETDRSLLTARSRERFADADPPGPGTDAGPGVDADALAWVREQFGDAGSGDHDTVGAVATDGDEVATATSTGGRWHALAGRVGDVPQVGAGFYAGGTAAASATGAGEDIARYGLARRTVAAVADGDDPGTAASRVIRGFGDETGAHAGVIVCDLDGRVGRAHNAAAMGTAGVE